MKIIKHNNEQLGAQTFPKSSTFLDHQIHKNAIFQTCFHIFLYSLKYFGIFKSINKGSLGVENP